MPAEAIVPASSVAMRTTGGSDSDQPAAFALSPATAAGKAVTGGDWIWDAGILNAAGSRCVAGAAWRRVGSNGDTCFCQSLVLGVEVEGVIWGGDGQQG